MQQESQETNKEKVFIQKGIEMVRFWGRYARRRANLHDLKENYRSLPERVLQDGKKWSKRKKRRKLRRGSVTCREPILFQ